MKQSIRHLLFALFLCSMAFAQTSVILAPVVKPQFFDNSGRTLAFGCVFSFASGTTNPLDTYTDATGSIKNSNPVILTAGGFAGSGPSGIWLTAGTAYTLKVVSQGGSNCASGQTQYTVNGIGGGGAVLTTIVPFSATPTFVIQAQVQLFQITLTGNAAANPLSAIGIVSPALIIFQITQDSAGAHTWAWPSNLIGGASIGLGANQTTTQMFVWNGTNATAVGPANIGNGSSFSFSPGYLVIPNASSTGTTLNTLTKLTGAPSTAVIAATTDTIGIQGVTVGGAGVIGSALIQTGGNAPCIFDGATVAGHYVQISATVAGDCHDTGLATYPAPLAATQVIGRVLSTNAAGGTYQISLFGPEIQSPPILLGGTPTLTVKAAAGAGATISAFPVVKDRGGEVQLNTGSGTTTTGDLFWVAFSTPFSTAAFCTVNMGNGTVPIIVNASTTTMFVGVAGTALATSSSYTFYYLCNGL